MIKDANNRMKILNECSSKLNIDLRQKTLNNIENLKIYAKAIDSKGHHEVLSEIKKSKFISEGRSLNFQREKEITPAKWMISGKTEIIPYDNYDTISTSYFRLFWDYNKVPDQIKENYKFFTDPFENFQKKINLNKSPLALWTGEGDEEKLIDLNPNKPLVFFYTSIYQEGAGHNTFAANIFKPEELENEIKEIELYLRDKHPILFQAKPAECEILLANTFLNMRVMNSTVLSTIMEQAKDLKLTKKDSF